MKFIWHINIKQKANFFSYLISSFDLYDITLILYAQRKQKHSFILTRLWLFFFSFFFFLHSTYRNVVVWQKINEICMIKWNARKILVTRRNIKKKGGIRNWRGSENWRECWKDRRIANNCHVQFNSYLRWQGRGKVPRQLFNIPPHFLPPPSSSPPRVPSPRPSPISPCSFRRKRCARCENCFAKNYWL